ncbi:MAG: hypothetical protein CBE00_03085 [Planctomycetaceae bacterium TMED240]|nr:hypothetical protein [Rhodopirellula sp.]OUX07880.1 MAG: hypothetical protein CBE00_03085 [Planctomycetaceae bacterium TMED240]
MHAASLETLMRWRGASSRHDHSNLIINVHSRIEQLFLREPLKKSVEIERYRDSPSNHASASQANQGEGRLISQKPKTLKISACKLLSAVTS